MPSSLPKVHLPLPTQGIRADLDPFHVPPDALRDTTQNWLLRNGRVVTRPGVTTLGQSTGVNDPPIGITSYGFGTTRFLVQATTDEWWLYNITTGQWDNISDAGLLWSGSATAFPATFKVFNSGGTHYLLGVRGGNTPRAWDSNPANPFALFGGSAPEAQCIAIVADRVVLGNLQNGPNTVDVSAFQDHTSGWGVTETAVLVDTPGRIVSMNELSANQTAIYKEDAIYLASGTTGITPIRFDLHSAYVPGPASNRAVVSLPSRQQAVFTEEGEVFIFDGATYTHHPSSERVRTLFSANASITTSIKRLIHGFYDHVHNELWWFYVGSGSEISGPADAIVINMLNGSVWKQTFPYSFTASHYGDLLSTSDTFAPAAFLGRNTGQAYLLDGETDGGLSISAEMETGMSDLGDPTRTKTIHETDHYFTNPSNNQVLQVSIAASEGGETPLYSEGKDVALTPTTTGPYITSPRYANGNRVTTRHLGVKIEGISITSQIEYLGTSATMMARGNR